MVDGDTITPVEIAVGPAGEVDEAAWREARAGGAAAIVPDRAAALRVGDRARGDGVRVLYRDAGAIWDPLPAGDWQPAA